MKNPVRICYTTVVVLLYASVCLYGEVSSTQTEPRPEAVSYDFKPKDTSWKSLSLREKIGQTMIVLADYNNHVRAFGNVENMLKQYPVGGLFVPDWIYPDHEPKTEVIANIQKCMRAYEAASKFPLIITEDFERGVGLMYEGYTHMPIEMALGAANKPELASAFGNAIAKEASTFGINWLLHPVVDLNMNPLQSLVIERAISDNAEHAYPLLKAQIRGMKDHGVISTIKHFPGDGVSMKNQHLITSNNTMSMSQWNSTFGALFQRLINDGAPCIMVGHIRLPAYQRETIKGVIPPATLSKELMVDLLKGEMKFNGVIMSDALNMGGIGGFYPNILESSIECFKAGVDLILWPELEYMDKLEEKISSGEIPISRLDDAVERIWGVREKSGLLEKKEEICYTLTEDDKATIKQTATKVAEAAVTLVDDRYKELPLRPDRDKKIAIINISHNSMSSSLQVTKKLLTERGFDVAEIIHNPSLYSWQRRLSEFEQYDRVIVAFENRYMQPVGTSMLKDAEAMGLWTASMIPFEKIIAISYSNPYYVNYYCDDAPIRLNAYSIDSFSQKAVVDALTGVIPIKGISPVQLDHKIMQ